MVLILLYLRLQLTVRMLPLMHLDIPRIEDGYFNAYLGIQNLLLRSGDVVRLVQTIADLHRS